MVVSSKMLTLIIFQGELQESLHQSHNTLQRRWNGKSKPQKSTLERCGIQKLTALDEAQSHQGSACGEQSNRGCREEKGQMREYLAKANV